MPSQSTVHELDPVPRDIQRNFDTPHYDHVEATWEHNGTRYALVMEEYAAEYTLLEEREDGWFVMIQTVSGRRRQCGSDGHSRQAKQQAVRSIRSAASAE